MRKSIIFLTVIACLTGYGQPSKGKLSGKYSDGITELILYADSTFELRTTDDIFPYRLASEYRNRGFWTHSANVVTLNPEKQKRRAEVYLSEKTIEGQDYIRIRINYVTEAYENDILISKKPFEFELLTLYVNNRKDYRNLVHTPFYRTCAFAPRVRRQVVVDSSNTINLPKKRVERLGVYSYGFEKPIELPSVNPNANSFEVTIIQPLDKERTPRSKKVIIRANCAYFYEYEGKIPTSGVLNGLKRME